MRWSLLFVLLALACKPAVRQAPESDLHAIADDSLTLGVTPVEKDDVQAYRLLVCKKAMSYPKWMLADESRCLPGLVTEEGDEVIILPDHLKRDFATKYKGYAKSTTWVVPAFALAAVGAVFGKTAAKAVAKTKPAELAARPVKWFTSKSFVEKPVAFVTNTFTSAKNWFGDTVTGIKGKFPDRFKLDDTAISDKYVLYYKAEAENALDLLTKEGKHINDTRGKVRSLEKIEELRASHRTKDLLQEQTKLKDANAVNARIKELEESIDGNFIEEYEGKITARLGIDDLGDRIKNTRKYHEMKSTSEVVDLLKTNKDNMPELTNAISVRTEEIIDTRIPNMKTELMNKHNVEFGTGGLKHKDARTLGVGHASVRAGASAVGRAATSDAAKGIGAGTVVAYGVMVSFDKSIWGYSDRQVSKHWSQIFHDQGDFGEDSASVRDLPGILKSLADAYGFTVNSKAIALGN